MNFFNIIVVYITLIVSSIASSVGIIHQPDIKHEIPVSIKIATPSATIIPIPTKKSAVKQVTIVSPQPTLTPTSAPQNNTEKKNTNSINNTNSQPAYIPVYVPSITTASPTPVPTSTPVQTPVITPQPVDHSLDLRICLNNEEKRWEAQMDDLNRRGVWSSGQADQARNNHADILQSCNQQYGN